MRISNPAEEESGSAPQPQEGNAADQLPMSMEEIENMVERDTAEQMRPRVSPEVCGEVFHTRFVVPIAKDVVREIGRAFGTHTPVNWNMVHALIRKKVRLWMGDPPVSQKTV